MAIAKGLVQTMRAYDADLVEINPLAIIRESRPGRRAASSGCVCLDAKVTLDDSALARHPGARGRCAIPTTRTPPTARRARPA